MIARLAVIAASLCLAACADGLPEAGPSVRTALEAQQLPPPPARDAAAVTAREAERGFNQALFPPPLPAATLPNRDTPR